MVGTDTGETTAACTLVFVSFLGTAFTSGFLVDVYFFVPFFSATTAFLTAFESLEAFAAATYATTGRTDGSFLAKRPFFGAAATTFLLFAIAFLIGAGTLVFLVSYLITATVDDVLELLFDYLPDRLGTTVVLATTLD